MVEVDYGGGNVVAGRTGRSRRSKKWEQGGGSYVRRRTKKKRWRASGVIGEKEGEEEGEREREKERERGEIEVGQ